MTTTSPEWVERRLSEAGVPLGGTAGQLLVKASDQDRDLTWSTAGPSSITPGTAGQLLLTDTTPATAWTTLTGDVTVTGAGVTAIGSGVIVNADVNASAAIAYSKLNLAGSIVNADVATGAAVAHSKLANTAAAGQVLMGNASSVVTATTISGDVTVSSGGVTAIGSGVIVNADVNASAAIDYSKLAALTAGNVVLGNASNVATSTALTGDVTVSSGGVTAIGSGVIVNADVNASAAIAYSKLNLATSIVNGDLSTTTGAPGGVWNVDTSTAGFTNVTSGNISRRWLIIGKTMHFRAWFTAGTATALGSVAFTLPASALATSGRNQIVLAVNLATIVTCVVTNGTGTVTVYNSNAGGTFAAGASLTNVTVEGTIELA